MPQRNHLQEIPSPEQKTKPPPSSEHNAYIYSDPDYFSSSASTIPLVFPPGFKFAPTDEELIFHYLKPFLEGNESPYHKVPIHRVNIYESNPEQLSKKYDTGNDKEWFFITERTKKREGGKVLNRSDNGGSWKILSTPKKIEAGQGVVGYKTLLDYRTGNGVKSDWIMHEYWFESSEDNNNKVDHALCKIFFTPKVRKRKAEEEENERRKKKMKGVATVEEVVQPCNGAFQQSQFFLPPLDLCQPQQQQLQNVANQPPQPQFFLVSRDSPQPQIFLVKGDQPCNTTFQQPQFSLPPLDPCQPHKSLIRKKLHNVATVIDVEAAKEEPCNAAFQQPRVSLPPLDLRQPHQPVIQKLHNYAYQPQQQLNNVDANQLLQPQTFLVSLDSIQPPKQEEQQLPILDLSDELSELIKFLQKPVIKDNAADWK